MSPANAVPDPDEPIDESVASAELTERQENALEDVYFVSGLGADERVFDLLECQGYNPVHIPWLTPERGEPIGDYAKRLAQQVIANDAANPTIVGLSFGGLVAVEMAKYIPDAKVVLLSSAKTAEEVPFYFQWFRWFPIHRIFPFKTLLWMGYWLADWFFSIETVEERRLLHAILIDTEPRFLKWALHKVVTWQNQTVPQALTHIHGGRDRIFPLRYVNPDHVLDDGGHLIVLNRAPTISQLLAQLI